MEEKDNYYFPDLVKDLERRGDDMEESFKSLKDKDADMLTKLKSKYLGKMFSQDPQLPIQEGNLPFGTSHTQVVKNVRESYPSGTQHYRSESNPHVGVLSPVSNNIITEFLGNNPTKPTSNKPPRTASNPKENYIGDRGKERHTTLPVTHLTPTRLDKSANKEYIMKSAEGRYYTGHISREIPEISQKQDFLSRRVSISELTDYDSKESTLVRIGSDEQPASTNPSRMFPSGRSRSMVPLHASSLGRKAAHVSNEEAWRKLIGVKDVPSPLISPQFYNEKSEIKGGGLMHRLEKHSHTPTVELQMVEPHEEHSGHQSSSFRTRRGYGIKDNSFLNPSQITNLYIFIYIYIYI